ncbi:unnamed protein product [Cylicocyclus nassatus]|uniref:Uncharacterized protein n=1 Tax=Cylicocyclus nassatus TaxID=53992 RepID=A0AA36GX76_CYLNA|nr:unnamed protein product [Cylicocyclus nassatus]
MSDEDVYTHSYSTCRPVAKVVVLLIVPIAVAVLFLFAYVALSEHHKEAFLKIQSIIKITDENYKIEMLDSVFWILDGTVVCICLFLILEDAFLLQELNSELNYLNCEAYLSLREALEVDNRYIKDAIILEAAENQEQAKTPAIQCKEESVTPTAPTPNQKENIAKKKLSEILEKEKDKKH